MWDRHPLCLCRADRLAKQSRRPPADLIKGRTYLPKDSACGLQRNPQSTDLSKALGLQVVFPGSRKPGKFDGHSVRVIAGHIEPKSSQTHLTRGMQSHMSMQASVYARRKQGGMVGTVRKDTLVWNKITQRQTQWRSRDETIRGRNQLKEKLAETSQDNSNQEIQSLDLTRGLGTN